MKGLGAAAAVLFGCIAAYLVAFPIHTYRYRLTVEVEAGGLVKSGSSVIQVRWITMPPIIPMCIIKDYEVFVQGEAVVVDLSPQAMVIVGLYGDEDPSRSLESKSAYNLLLAAHGLKANREGLSAISSLKHVVEVPVSLLPKLIILRNPHDPKTIQLVTPVGATNEIGNGYRLRSATAQITDATLTQVISAKLPWLDDAARSARPVAVLDRGHGPQPVFHNDFVEE